MHQLINHQVISNAQRFGRDFNAAKPFRHVVIENFFAPDYASALLAQFPAFDTKRAFNEAGQVGGKAVVEQIRAIGNNYATLDDLVQSSAFLALVGQLTGIANLRYDPHYFGGGTHENRSGQDLDPHIDFNRHPVENWHRRLNLIVYLNHDWQKSWGGNLEIHRDPYAADNSIVQIVPLFNRCVIFETNEISWHAFDRIALPPELADTTRKSIALYFYTDTRPAEELGDTHSTVYVDRPLPGHLHAGHVLSAADMDAIKTLLARRDHHLQRLYRDLSERQKEIEGYQAALKRGYLGQAVFFARRLVARLMR
jgi:hypothetical protein